MTQWLTTYRAAVPDYGLAQLCGCGYWKSVFGSCVPDPESGQTVSHSFSPRVFLSAGRRETERGRWRGALASDLAAAGYSVLGGFRERTLTAQTEKETAGRVSALLGEIPEAVGAGSSRCVCPD